jgi:threonine synthase
VCAAQALAEGTVPVICLATAHPAKFGAAVFEATGSSPQLPESLQGIEQRPKRCESLAAETGLIKDYLDRHSL